MNTMDPDALIEVTWGKPQRLYVHDEVGFPIWVRVIPYHEATAGEPAGAEDNSQYETHS